MLTLLTGGQGACLTCQTHDARDIVATFADTLPAEAVDLFKHLLLGLHWQAACPAGTFGLAPEGFELGPEMAARHGVEDLDKMKFA